MGIAAIPTWELQWWSSARRFSLQGREYPCYYHSYNCGWPPYATERCVELALADAWLKNFQPDEVIEIGAVTPYYWPHRIQTVIDPFDEHELVSHKQSLFDITIDRPTLSISTFEHIGMGDYGSSEPSEAVVSAFEKLFSECPRFLVTVPVGYNAILDRLLFETGVPDDVSLDFLMRNDTVGWESPQSPDKARQPYGDQRLQSRFPGTSIGVWANAIAILQRDPVGQE